MRLLDNTDKLARPILITSLSVVLAGPKHSARSQPLKQRGKTTFSKTSEHANGRCLQHFKS